MTRNHRLARAGVESATAEVASTLGATTAIEASRIPLPFAPSTARGRGPGPPLGPHWGGVGTHGVETGVGTGPGIALKEVGAAGHRRAPTRNNRREGAGTLAGVPPTVGGSTATPGGEATTGPLVEVGVGPGADTPAKAIRDRITDGQRGIVVEGDTEAGAREEEGPSERGLLLQDLRTLAWGLGSPASQEAPRQGWIGWRPSRPGMRGCLPKPLKPKQRG